METPDEDQSGRDTRRCSGPVKPVARILSDRFPTYEEGDLALFETGSIVFHIAERHAGLLPDDADARRARSHGCLPRSTRWSQRSLNSQPPGFWRAISPGVRSAR